MSGEKKRNPKKVVLIILVVVLLVGACFTAVALYARRELNKPKFIMPEIEPEASAAALPTDQAASVAYVNGLFADALAADDVELTVHTDVNLGGDIESPLADADREILSFLRDQAGGQIAGLYPTVSAVRMPEVEENPKLPLENAFVTEYTAEQGQKNDDGTIRDDDRYFFSFTIDPASVDTASMDKSAIYGAVLEKFGSAVSVNAVRFECVGARIAANADRVYNQLRYVGITRTYRVTADVTFGDDYKALTPDGKATITIPYETTEHLDFNWYGARFVERAIVVTSDDMQALPASVVVNKDASQEDYELTFTESNPDIMEIDEDGVMTISGESDAPVTVKMTLKYDGHVYEDELIVYISDLEVQNVE